MNIDFRVSKDYLIARIINSRDKNLENAKDIYEIQKLIAEGKDVKIPQHLIDKVREVEGSSEFQQLYKENLEYMDSIKEYYQGNREKIEGYLRTLGIDLNDLQLTSFISHPTFNAGQNMGGNIFFFGHSRGVEDKNYNIIYLIHESLHSFIPYNKYSTMRKAYEEMQVSGTWDSYWNSLSQEERDKYNQDYSNEVNIIHSIIELTTDNELYTRLSGKTTYTEGHEDLANTKKTLYPYWFLYLGLNEDEVSKRIPLEHLNMEVYNNPKIIERIRKISSISEFIELCLNDFRDLQDKNSIKL